MPPSASSRSELLARALFLGAPLLAVQDWRFAVIAGLGAALGLVFPGAAGCALALLVAGGVLRGPLAIVSALVALGALLLWPRDLRRLAVLLGTVGLAALATRDPRAIAVALAATLVLLSPLGERAPLRWRTPLLLLATLPAIYGGLRAHRALASGRWSEAEARCRSLHWNGCVERAVIAQAKQELGAGKPAQALAALERVPYPPSGSTELLHAQLELGAHEDDAARARLQRLANREPGSTAALDPPTATLWARMLARSDQRARALETLAHVAGPEAAGLRALLSRPPAPLLAGQTSFAGALRLVGITPPPRCVARGAPLGMTLIWQVDDGFGPGENLYCFVHANGSSSEFGFDHLVGGRQTSSLVPGERVVDRVELAVPATAPPGRYQLRGGLYSQGNGLRLHPRGQPGHISFAELGLFEVCP